MLCLLVLLQFSYGGDYYVSVDADEECPNDYEEGCGDYFCCKYCCHADHSEDINNGDNYCGVNEDVCDEDHDGGPSNAVAILAVIFCGLVAVIAILACVCCYRSKQKTKRKKLEVFNQIWLIFFKLEREAQIGPAVEIQEQRELQLIPGMPVVGLPVGDISPQEKVPYPQVQPAFVPGNFKSGTNK